MRLDGLAELAPAAGRIVIINAHTELVTTLALASAHRFGAGMPILLLDCDATEASTAYFDSLMATIPFDVVTAPLYKHGDTLDHIFPKLQAEIVLLLDSDAEIRDEHIVENHLSYFDIDRVFGAGYINNNPAWSADERGQVPKTGMADERPWMPYVLLRSSHVCEALEAGASFHAQTIFNDVAGSKRLSRLLASRLQLGGGPGARVVSRLPVRIRDRLRSSRLPMLAWARRDFYGKKPNYVTYDTGAEVYKWLKYERDLIFAGMHVRLLRGEIAHYDGVTRLKLLPNQQRRRAAMPLDAIEPTVIGRLRDVYGFTSEDLSRIPETAPSAAAARREGAIEPDATARRH